MGTFLKIVGAIVLGLVGLCVVGVILVMVFAPSSSSTQVDRQSSAAVAPTAMAHIGDDVQVGTAARWKVLEVKNLGNKVGNNTTPGSYVLVRVEVENLGKEAASFDTVELLDSQGRHYKYDSDAVFHLPDGESCTLEQLNPNVPKTCASIFAVPADAAGLQLDVGDLNIFSQDHALIALD